jgi:hypothetical protein
MPFASLPCFLSQEYNGSFHNLLLNTSADGGKICDALTLAQRVVDVFPAFRDEHIYPRIGRGMRRGSGHQALADALTFQVKLWKRPQILVAELWAALSSVANDPAFPYITGIERLTMFAD